VRKRACDRLAQVMKCSDESVGGAVRANESMKVRRRWTRGGEGGRDGQEKKWRRRKRRAGEGDKMRCMKFHT
jgi:hypothetical protein